MLSIIIPIYNVEKYVEACVDSVVSQRGSFEVILVDDGSTDTSGILCDEMHSKYPCVEVIHKENGGLSDARNAGILKARGDYLLFLDGDDELLPDSLKNIEKVIEDSRPDVIIGRYVCFSEDGLEEVDGFRMSGKVDFKSADTVIENLCDNPCFSSIAWRNIVRRDYIVENSLYFKKGIFHEDEEWTPRVICSCSRFGYLDEPFYHYRVGRKQSIMNTPNIKRAIDKLETAKSLYKLSYSLFNENIRAYYLRYRAAKIYTSIVIFLFENSPTDRKKILSSLNCEKYLLKDINDPKIKVERFLITTIGLENTAKLFGFRQKRKKGIM